MRLRRSLSLFSIALVTFGGAFAACSSADDQATDSGVDTGLPSDDSAPPDTAVADSAMDSGSEVANETSPPDAPADTPPLPFSEKLSEMSLFSDFGAKKVAPNNIEFQPTYQLWADGLTKRRWMALPPGTQIDNTDMDHWVFPVGTRFWKEFSKAGKRLETRLLWQESAGSWKMGTYIWNDTETEATWTQIVSSDIRGSGWDSPSETMCKRCHEGEPGRVLGLSAIQMAEALGGVNLAGLDSTGLLKVPLDKTKQYGAPGTSVEKAALGYLHANCGHCHNKNNALTSPLTDQKLRLNVAERNVPTTEVYESIVNHKTDRYIMVPYRVHGADTANSAIYVRQTIRDGASQQMPPIATKQVNPDGLATVKAWIDSLPPGPPIADAGTD